MSEKKIFTVNVLRALFIVFAAAMFPACEEDDNTPSNSCGGALTQTPDYVNDVIHYSFDGATSADTLATYTSGIPLIVFPDSSGYTITFRWTSINSVYLSINKKLGQDSIPNYYELAAPRQLPFGKLNPDGSLDRSQNENVAINITSNGKMYRSELDDNSNAYFEITNRSAVFEYQGDSVVNIEGVVCCTVYSHDTQRMPKELFGNFSGKVKVN